MTQTDNTKQKLRNFVTETFLMGDEDEKLNDTESCMQTGIKDSTGVLELASFVEQEFEITIEDDEMTPSNLDSIDNLASFVTKKLG